MSGGGAAPVWRIAVRDLVHDWRLSLVAALGVAVALAPLIILFGLKLGAVDSLREALESDPRNLALTMRGGGAARFDEAWFASIAAQPETGFVSPMTRGTVARIYLINPDSDDAEPADVSLLPTGVGDPVLDRAGLAPPSGEALVLSAAAAETLGLAADSSGVSLTALIRRTDGARTEAETLAVSVAGVLPPALADGAAAYVPLPFIVAVEDYREWQRVERYGWPGDTPLDDPHADFRLYARDIDSVEPLRAHLRTFGVEVESAANRIATVRRIDADLTLVFGALLSMTVVGYAAALALNQLAAVARKRQTLAVLRLIGYRGRALMAIPVIQGVALASAGAGIALFLFLAMEPLLGALFSEQVERRGSLMRFPARYVAVVIAGSAGIAAIASLFAARQAFAIQPSKELRNV